MTARLALALLACLAGAVGSLLSARTAAAAPYEVWSCRDADGAPLSTQAWVPGGNAGASDDTCAAGGALSVTLGPSDLAAGARTGYRFDVPRGVTIESYTALLAATASNLSILASYVAGLGQGDGISVPTVFDGCYTNLVGTCVAGDLGDPDAPANEVGLPVFNGGLGFLAYCASPIGAPCIPGADPPATARLFRSTVVLDDPSAPSVGMPGGTIAAGGTVSGTRTVSAAVADEGSGILRTELLVDGTAVDARDGVGTCAAPFTVADPCPTNALATFALDTAALAPGQHTVAVRARDAAQNVAAGPALTFTVAHPPPPSPTVVTVPALPAPPAPPITVEVPSAEPEPPAEPLRVRLRLPDRIELPSRRDVSGTVIGPDGTPRAGVEVRFRRRAFGTSRWSATGSPVASGADGRFTLPLPRESAQLRVVARSETIRARAAVVDVVRELDARIGASDEQLRNGQELTLGGRFRHAGGALEGREVLVQGVVRGRWRTIDSVEADDDGRVRWDYRFTNTRQSARYRLRLVLPKAKRLPWGRTVSPAVTVTVRAD